MLKVQVENCLGQLHAFCRCRARLRQLQSLWGGTFWLPAWVTLKLIWTLVLKSFRSAPSIWCKPLLKLPHCPVCYPLCPITLPQKAKAGSHFLFHPLPSSLRCLGAEAQLLRGGVSLLAFRSCYDSILLYPALGLN